MKKLIYCLLFTSMLFTSCSEDISTCENCDFTCLEEDEPNVLNRDCKDNWTCEFKILPDSKVDTREPRGVADGNKNVFQLISRTEGSPGIADDETSVTIVFELNKNQSSFSVEGNDLKNMKVHYKKSCYCPEVIFLEATSGCIQGEEQADGSWFIQGRIRITNSDIIIEEKFEERFRI